MTATPTRKDPTALLEEVFRQSPSFLHVLRGPDLVFELANEAYCRLVGLRDLIGRPAFDVMPEAAAGGFPDRIATVMATREPFVGRELPVMLARTPGAPPEERLVDLMYLPLLEPDGTCIRVLGHGTDVTEHVRARRRAEADALRRTEARYHALFESIDEGFCVVEVLFDEAGRPTDYRFLEANPAFAQHTGLADAIGRTARELLPDLEPHWFEIYGRVARTGEPERFQAPSEAMQRWFDVYAFRVDRPVDAHVAILFIDRSAAMLAERERDRLLRELEVERARLATVFAQTPSVLAIVRGPQHVLTLANEAYLALNGHRDVIGKPLLDAVPELRGQGFDVLLDRVVATGEPFVGREVPIRLSTSPGAAPEERFFDFVYLPLVETDGEGRPQRVGVIAHGNDITEQVRARREVERERDRADQLQALTAALAATTTPEEVADVVVAQGVAATGAATGLLAMRISAPSGDHPGEGAILRHHGVIQAVLDEYTRFPLTKLGPVAECLRTGHAVFIEGREGLHARYPDIQQLFIGMGTQAVATVPLSVAGDVVGAMSFSWAAPRTLSAADREMFLAFGRQAAQALERARLFAAERAARAEAEGANRAKSEFLAVMSHELRTPLNAIGGYAELIELGIHGPVTDAQRAALARIQHSQRHLLGLIAGVLDYSRVEAGAVSYSLVPIPVADAVAEAEVLVSPQLRAKGLGFTWRGAPPELEVLADREKLQQILLNLLGNAVKFTYPRDGRPGHVEVSCTEGTMRGIAVVRLHVRDTGEGIDVDQRARIFEPFVQADQRLTRPHEGVGLGLAISRDLARGMGGDLSVESARREGSTFTLTLPRAGQPEPSRHG